MIKVVVKRDGEEQAFDANKLNKWAEWAGEKLEEWVDWSSVVTNAVSFLPEKATSKELQESLIRTCLDRNTNSYNLMAGRLYAPLMVKEIHGGEYPSIKSLHSKLRDKGIMVDFGATEEDYKWAEEVIDHSKNLKMPHFQQNFIINKYGLKDRVSGEVYETPQYTFMRMAMELSVHEEDLEKRKEHIYKFYTYLSDGKLNAPTPNYTNLGTALRGFASCNVMTTNDTAASLAAHDHIAYVMTYMSAGIGSHVNSRSLNDPVRGGQIAHLGKLPLYRSLSTAVKTMLQNGRGGAATTFYTCFDPEVEVIMRLKNPMSTEERRIRGIDYAFQSNRLFAKKVARNEDIFLFNSFTAPELYEAFYGGDEDYFEELYERYEKDDGFKKKYVNARSILLAVMEESFATGRAYLHFPIEANRHTPFNETIYSSNLCVAPETLVLTDAGYKEIQELEGQKVTLWNGEEWSDTEVLKTGENQELVRVTTDSGMEVDCTPYHKFYVVTDYRGTVVEKRAHELKSGDKLIKSDFPVIQGTRELDRAYLNGFFSADGCHYKGRNIVYLYDKKKSLSNYFDSLNPVTKNKQEDLNRIVYTFGGLKEKMFVPDSEYSVKSRLDWLAGYLDGDGCVYTTEHSNGASQQLTASSTDKNFLKEVQLMLHTIGIQSKITKNSEEGMKPMPKNDGSGEYGEFYCKKSYRLLIPTYESYKLLEMGLELKRLNISKVRPQRDSKRFVQVESVENLMRKDDTYCFTEPKRNMGVFNGILAGNCLEINLPTKGYNNAGDLYKEEDVGGEVALCSLAGICVDKVSEEEYEDVMYYALLMIDRCIHLSHYELPNVGYTAKRRLNAGVGILGLAHHLAKNGLKYTTQEGKEEINKIAERHMYYAIRASLRLGKELGNAPWINKTKWVDGWLPIDTYNKFVDNVVSNKLQYDWEALRKEVVDNGGIRNSALVAHFPSESSSKAANTTSSLYPIRELNMQRSDATTSIYWSAPDSDRLKDAYESAWNIPWKDMVDVYAIVQKYTDQGISADLWANISGDVRVSSAEMIQQYLYIVNSGIKSRYYVNFRTHNKESNVTSSDFFDEEGSDCETCTL